MPIILLGSSGSGLSSFPFACSNFYKVLVHGYDLNTLYFHVPPCCKRTVNLSNKCSIVCGFGDIYGYYRFNDPVHPFYRVCLRVIYRRNRMYYSVTLDKSLERIIYKLGPLVRQKDLRRPHRFRIIPSKALIIVSALALRIGANSIQRVYKSSNITKYWNPSAVFGHRPITSVATTFHGCWTNRLTIKPVCFLWSRFFFWHISRSSEGLIDA